MTGSFQRVRNSYNRELSYLARITKKYPFKLLVWNSHEDNANVEDLRLYLNKHNVDYYFVKDSFYFKTEEDRSVAQWVK